MTICTKNIKISEEISIGANEQLAFIGGPCVIENEKTVMVIAERLKEISSELDINVVFKASFDKANRSSAYSFRGPGLEQGLKILARVKRDLGLPILTDVHEPWQCKHVAEVADILQIPAYLCRQTDLLVAAAKTGRTVNVKKGQFLAPWDMQNVILKIEEAGNNRILLTERGVTFGYNNLVVDMRSLIEMKNLGYPVVFDATHSVQKPGGKGSSSGGDREYIAPLMRGAVAVGVDAIFSEVHVDPDNALCDGPNMIKLTHLRDILKTAIEINNLVRNHVNEGLPDPKAEKSLNEAALFLYEQDELSKKLSSCNTIICDVDGVLTDGKMIYSEKGDEIKNFNVRDGIAARILKEKGFKLGILSSGKDGAIVRKRGQMLDFDVIDVGEKPKKERFLNILTKLSLDPTKVIYICDDINDIEVTTTGCLVVCPNDAHSSIKKKADWVLESSGGQGCLREVADKLLDC